MRLLFDCWCWMTRSLKRTWSWLYSNPIWLCVTQTECNLWKWKFTSCASSCRRTPFLFTARHKATWAWCFPSMELCRVAHPHDEVWRPLVWNIMSKDVSLLLFPSEHHAFFKSGPWLCARTCLASYLTIRIKRVFFLHLSMNMHHKIVIYLLWRFNSVQAFIEEWGRVKYLKWISRSFETLWIGLKYALKVRTRDFKMCCADVWVRVR